MKVANTRKINERITQFLEREELNNLIGMGVSAPVSMNEIVFDDYAYLKNIHFDHQTLGRFELTHASYSKYEAMMYTIPVSKYYGIMIPRIDYHYPSRCI